MDEVSRASEAFLDTFSDTFDDWLQFPWNDGVDVRLLHNWFASKALPLIVIFIRVDGTRSSV